MTGMVLLVLRGDRLEIVDANDTALQLLDDGRTRVVGRYLDRVLTEPSTLRGVIRETCVRRPRRLARAASGSRTAPAATSRSRSRRSPAATTPTFSAQLLDVSAEYAALARTAAAERLTSATLDTTNCIIMVTDMDGTVVRVNQATTTLTGFPEDADPGPPGLGDDRPAAPGADRAQAMFAAPDGSAIPGTREANVQTATGETLRVVWNNDLVRDEDGTPRYAVMTGVDVTAERTTRRADDQPVPGRHLDGDHRHRQPRPDHAVQLRGRGAARLDGRARCAAAGSPTCSTPPSSPSAPAQPGAGVERADRDRSARGASRRLDDWTWRTAHGRRRTVAMTLSGGGSQFGPQAGYLVVGRDVTEQRHCADDADGGAGEGADGGRPAATARHREERVRLDGQPRAADAGHQHRRLRRAAGRRLAGAGRPARSCRCSTPSRATAPG